jgi:hypothetical protein
MQLSPQKEPKKEASLIDLTMSDSEDEKMCGRKQVIVSWAEMFGSL